MSNQALIAKSIIDTLGPNGLNTLAFIEMPKGVGSQFDVGVFFGPANSYKPITNGIICRLPNEETLNLSQNSPYENVKAESFVVTLNLYLKRDIDTATLQRAEALLTGQGLLMPSSIEYMSESFEAMLEAFHALKRNGAKPIRNIQTLATYERDERNDLVAQRKCRIDFVSQFCSVS